MFNEGLRKLFADRGKVTSVHFQSPSLLLFPLKRPALVSKALQKLFERSSTVAKCSITSTVIPSSYCRTGLPKLTTQEVLN
ncbi:hypothetical protein C1J03_14855 [Sulfitobacter sp. SK012]|nr:hypothetical protein C1J03_14855 [Sulfitobacter sp. SK012]